MAASDGGAAGMDPAPPPVQNGAGATAIDDTPTGQSTVTNPELCDASTLQVGPAPVRRLSRLEYNNAVRDLLGDTSRPADTFVAEERVVGFASNTSTPVTEVINEQYLDAALKLAETALTGLAPRFPCLVQLAQSQDGEACARQVLHDVARQAYRGSLDAEEEERLVTLYRTTAAELDTAAGVQAGLAAVLTSPRFLYVVELGTAGVADAVVALTGQEVAARLAFFLWRSLPDEELLAAAEAGTLGTADEVEAQARRMFEDARADAALSDFVAQWMSIEKVPTLNKSAEMYPAFTEEVKRDLLAETLAFYRETVRGDAGDVATLLTATHSYLNPNLAQFYGVGSMSPDPGTFLKTELNATAAAPQRAGILTHGSVLAAHAHPTRPSPVHRGQLVREKMLCQPLPPPPPNVNNVLPEGNGESTRDVANQHATDPACVGCHKLMDPIGFGFGNYDGTGKYLDTENGVPIDAQGEVVNTTPELDGPFTGAVELVTRMAASGVVEPCFALQSARYALGRAETNSDACSLQGAYADFAASGFKVRELLIALTRSDSFRFRRRVDAGQQCL